MGQTLEAIMTSIQAAATAFGVQAPDENHVQSCIDAAQSTITTNVEALKQYDGLLKRDDLPWTDSLVLSTSGLDVAYYDQIEVAAEKTADNMAARATICAYEDTFNEAVREVFPDDKRLQHFARDDKHYSWASHQIYDRESTCQKIDDAQNQVEWAQQRYDNFNDRSTVGQLWNSSEGSTLETNLNEAQTISSAFPANQVEFCADIKGTYSSFTGEGIKGGFNHLRDAENLIEEQTLGKIVDELKRSGVEIPRLER